MELLFKTSFYFVPEWLLDLIKLANLVSAERLKVDDRNNKSHQGADWVINKIITHSFV